MSHIDITLSFEVQDMTKAINVPASVLNDINLLQLVDDSALLAEDIRSLCKVFDQCLKLSDKNYMYINVNRTVFLHVWKYGYWTSCDKWKYGN